MMIDKIQWCIVVSYGKEWGMVRISTFDFGIIEFLYLRTEKIIAMQKK